MKDRALRRLGSGCVFILLLVLAACSNVDTTIAPPSDPGKVVGFAEITFRDITSGIDASAEVLQAATLSSQAIDFQGGLSFDSATRQVAVNDVGGFRFVSVDIEVVNSSGSLLENITFLPYSLEGLSFNDTPLGPTPFVLATTSGGGLFTDLDDIKPSHGVDASGIVEANRADFVAYGEDELQGLVTDLVDNFASFATNVRSVYPYAFVARSANDPNSRSIAAGARGTISFTFRVPVQDAPSDDLDDVSIRVFFTTDSETRVTEGAFGDSFTDARNRAQTVVGATEIAAIGPGTRNVGGATLTPFGFDNVRLTGTASLPTGFLLELSGPPTFTNFTPVYVDDSAPPGGDGSSLERALQTISRGVEVVAPNGAIIVAAGTYAESVIIDKPLALRGPNESADPTVGPRGGEAKLIPPINNLSLSTTDSQNFLLAVEADNVTITGLELNGDNPNLSGGEPLNGVDVNVAYGILNRSGSGNNVVITNNIIRNLYYRGVSLAGNATTSFTGQISDNFFDNLPFIDTNIGGGRAIALSSNYYADVEGNLIERVYIGILTIGFNVAGTPTNISNNEVSSSRIGIWINNHFNDASAFTLDSNTISSIDTDDPNNDQPATSNTGIFLASIQENVTVDLTNNNVSDAFAAVEFLNDPTNDTLTVVGGTLTGNLYGVLLYSASFSFSDTPQGDTSIEIDGTTINQTLTANRVSFANFEPAGIYVLDNGTADLVATIAAGTTVNVSGIGPQAVQENNPNTTGTAAITSDEMSITVDPRSISPGPGPLSIGMGRYLPNP